MFIFWSLFPFWFPRFQVPENYPVCNWVFISVALNIHDMLNQKHSSSTVHSSHNCRSWHFCRNSLHNSDFLWTIYKWNCCWLLFSNGLPFCLCIIVPIHHSFNTRGRGHRCQRYRGWGQCLVEASSPYCFIISLWWGFDNGRSGLLPWRFAFAIPCLGKSLCQGNNRKALLLLVDNFRSLASYGAYWFVGSVPQDGEAASQT